MSVVAWPGWLPVRLLKAGPGSHPWGEPILLTASRDEARGRRHGIAERAAWVVAVACVVLSLLWHRLYLDADPLWVQLNTASQILPHNTPGQMKLPLRPQ